MANAASEAGFGAHGEVVVGEESPSRALFHWTFATAKLDESTRQLSVDGVEATLEPRPLELLGTITIRVDDKCPVIVLG